jgi:hypothetical protein
MLEPSVVGKSVFDDLVDFGVEIGVFSTDFPMASG